MGQIEKYKIFLIVVVVFQLVGCAPKLTLVYHREDFKPNNIDVITVFPVLDARRHVFVNDNFEEETEKIQELILKKLKKKGYPTKVINDTNAMGDIQPTMIPFLDSDRIREIGPSDANWILLPTVVALKTFMGATSKSGEIVCYLYEKRTGKLVWEGSGWSTDLLGAAKGLMSDLPSNK